MGRRTRIHEGNYCTVGMFSLRLGRTEVNGFSWKYHKDEYIWGDTFEKKRFIERRETCHLILDPVQHIRSHGLMGQAQMLVKNNIWPEVARGIILLVRQSETDTFCLGFRDKEQLEILKAPLERLPLFVGTEFENDSTQRILETLLKVA